MMRSGHRRWYIYTLVLLLCGLGQLSWAASPADMRYFGLTEGLPHRRVNCVLPSASGYLWVGTDNGLSRFDGTAFHRPGRADGNINRGVILALLETSPNQLWVGTSQGLSLLNTQTGVEKLIRADPQGTTLAHQQVRALAVATDGTLYLGTKAGWLLRRRPGWASERVLRLTSAAATATWIAGIVPDGRGNLWLATQHNGAVYCYSPARRHLQRHEIGKAGPDELASFEPTAVARTASGQMLASWARHGLYQLDTVTNRFRKVQAAGAQDREALLAVDAQQRVWSAAARGTLLRYDSLLRQPYALTPSLLPLGAVVRCLAPARSGGMWAGTSNGLLLFQEPAAAFTTLLHQAAPLPNQPYSLRGLLEAAPGRLLAGTYRGLLDVQVSTGHSQPVWRNLPNGQHQPIVAYALLPDSAGRGAWLGTEGDGLAWLDFRTRQLRYFTSARDEQQRPVTRFIRALAHDAHGNLWLGTYEGAYCFSPATGRFVRLAARQYPELRDANCFSLMGRKKEIWLGTQQGLYRVTDTATVYRYEALRGTAVRAIWADTVRQETWLGTNRGLGRLRSQRLTWLSQKQGLPNDMVNALLPGAGRQLWISTDNGLCVIDRASLSVRTFQGREGLPVTEFNHGSALRTRQGALWFGSVNGLVQVRPQREQPIAAAPLLLTQLTYDDSRANRLRTRYPSPAAPPRLTMQPDDRFFSVSFVLADFDDPQRHRYAYRLAGLDRQWTDLGPATSVRFNRLPAGHYTLWLRAAGRSGRWTPAQQLLLVTVTPPFYARAWFWALSSLVAGAFLWAVHRYRQRRRRQLAELRTRIAADLHDDVGSLLTQISLESSLLRELVPLPEHQERLERVADASRTAARQMSDVVWSLDSRNDSVASLLERMRDHAYEVLPPAGIESDFNLMAEQLPPTLPLLVRQQVYLIYKEALHNVVKHAQASLVTVQLYRNGSQLVLEVKDDGRGYTGTGRPAGHGLRNMRERASQLRGTVLFGAGEEHKGFRVRVQLPLP
ncbi:sensor histidine kinase [Hymenobacter guriensis]|uniref:histidine kinase n=1 Tax=Hymenobacter guriensis TaxID=2793065 RepID=A0ABS0L2I6_9BACT|nr:sensor histidine kinase [Hymenobacter guriensis]MBG8554333.1 hypothetical protein [Hymenobacter guriensis]